MKPACLVLLPATLLRRCSCSLWIAGLCAVLGCLGAPVAHAQGIGTSLTCQPATGPALTLQLYGVSLSAMAPGTATLYTSLDEINGIVAAAGAQTVFSSCTFYTAAAPVVLTGVTFQLGEAYGSSPSLPLNYFGYQFSPIASKNVAFALAGLTFSGISASPGPLASSAPFVGSLACGASGTLPVYAYSYEGTPLGAGGFSFGTDLGALVALKNAVASATVVPSCTLSTTFSATFTDVSPYLLSVVGFGPQVVTPGPLLYAQINGTASSVTVSGTPSYGPPLGTLSCPGSGGTALSYSFYDASFNDDADAQGDLLLGADAYAALSAAQTAHTVYPSCTATLGATVVTLTNVTVNGSSIAGDGGLNAYTGNIFSDAQLTYTAFSVGGVTVNFPAPAVARAAERIKASEGARPRTRLPGLGF